MNQEEQGTAFVNVVEVHEHSDGTYVFADLDDARAFEATVDAGDPPTFVVPSCSRIEEVVCGHADALKLIAAECEATPEAEAASLESGVPVAAHARSTVTGSISTRTPAPKPAFRPSSGK